MDTFIQQSRPYTITRGLPYIIGPEYLRLRRLVREYDHMLQWHSRDAQHMIAAQCEKLHYRVYGTVCYYGDLPPECYAYHNPTM